MFFKKQDYSNINFKVLMIFYLSFLCYSCSLVPLKNYEANRQELLLISEEGNNKMPNITGRIKIQSNQKPSKNTTVYIRLIDTTDQDAAAIIMTEQILPNIIWSAVGDLGLAFELSAEDIVPTRRYEISVLVDCDGDGQLSDGDFYTTQSYPVLTQGFPHHIEIHVSQI
jgi:hypothetical protein